MTSEDVDPAEAAWEAALSSMRRAHHLPPFPRTPESVAADRRRVAYLQATDPGGSWVADHDGQVVGIAQAHRRTGIWVLATLGVVPDAQDHHVGRHLLERALAYGDAGSSGAIFSSPDHRALRRYVLAGFDLHPAVVAAGPRRRPVERQSGIRQGDRTDLDHVDQVDEVVRGGTRRGDIEFQLAQGCRLLVDPEGGYALVRHGRIVTLAGTTEALATRLLVHAMAECLPDEPVEASWITAGQQWAIRALADAGVPFGVHGAVMTRGGWNPSRPYLPNGIFG